MRKAILKLKEKVIIWPDAEEKERMKLFIKCKHGFQECVGIIDGALIILHDRPHVFGDSDWTRKTCYALNVQVICDHHFVGNLLTNTLLRDACIRIRHCIA